MATGPAPRSDQSPADGCICARSSALARKGLLLSGVPIAAVDRSGAHTVQADPRN